MPSIMIKKYYVLVNRVCERGQDILLKHASQVNWIFVSERSPLLLEKFAQLLLHDII
jgi:hypothetical protein